MVQRRFLWSEMQLISELKKPRLILGDFNVVLFVEEKMGGRSLSRRSMLDFNDCLNTCELLQATKIRLDFSCDWEYQVGIRIASDHSPLLGGCANIPKPCNVPLRFQKMWLEHPEFMKLTRLKAILKEWNWNVFGNVRVKIKEAEEKVREKVLISDKNPNDEISLQDLVIAENEFNSREVQYSTMMKQKSRIQWIKEGSSNTNFLHSNIKIRQTKNMICELKDDSGNLISDQRRIAETLVQFFEKRFQFQEVQVNDSLLEVIPKMVTDEDQAMLDAIP
ncbi:uncharacterized protein LOC113294558 [Papaver somniferum]|uniref:uncharacterized protein LOC113294558 n=1 Tax=Papaver somniferum TaxID=3469 RepID=UPI000E6F65FF|nr:uncharacterized protein LOC113294558 [Papaver somniferum]